MNRKGKKTLMKQKIIKKQITHLVAMMSHLALIQALDTHVIQSIKGLTNYIK